MFSSDRLKSWVLSIVFVMAGGCSGGGFGCGCDMQPLPGGMLPPDQTVEGGAQIRVTPAGFNKLTSVIPGVVNDLIMDMSGSGDLCIPRNQVVDAFVAEATICGTNDGNCTQGCQIDLNIDSINMSVPNDGTFNVRVQLDADVDVHVDYEIFFVVSGTCTAKLTANNVVIDIDVGFGIRPSDGELEIGLDRINTLNLSGVNVNGCGAIGSIVNAAISLVSGLLNSFLGDVLLDLLAPLLDGFIQDFLPDPLGIEGVMDVGALTGTVSPGTNASLEVRGVPGGYVRLVNGGLSLGLITGLNADEDPSTRSRALDSEPALCVPPFAAPDFSAPPASLPTVFRSAFNGNTFSLAPADAFLGTPDPAADIAIGLSETTLDLAGHHLVTSGMMCMGLGTSLIEQLNLGTIGILVPSLAELGNPDGTDPLLLVTRPQKPLDFTIGEGTETDPSLTIHVKNFEIDFYAFIFDRFVRGFTIEVTMDIGVNLEATTDDEGNPAILPVLTGLDTESITIKVHNAEFLREDQATLEDVLPAIFDLAIPLVTDGLDAFTLPDFAGFTLENVQVAKVTTSQDDFLAIYATLGTTSAFAALGTRFPSVLKLANQAQQAPVTRATTRATLRSVVTPSPERIRRGLGKHADGALPAVTIDVETHDDLGRELEWTWNINNGIWRPFTSASPLVIKDRALAFQGKHTIGLRSRVKGDYRTMDTETLKFPVVIDSVGPRIHGRDVKVEGGKLQVPVHDLVSKKKVQVAFGHVSDRAPATEWRGPGDFSLEEVRHLISADNALRVWARDELGNTSSTDLDMNPILGFHGSGGAGSGCDCDSAGAGELGGLALMFALTCLLLFGGELRRRGTRVVLAKNARKKGRLRGLTILPFALLIAGALMVPGCSCGGDPADAPSCTVNEECIDFCPEGTVPLCFENSCLCADDVPYGRIGKYSDMAISSGGAAWVSAYNSSHGDLMVARFEGSGRIPNENWEFVDGVPEGPVVLPESDVRGGIFDAGPDVGQYTSIAVGPNDEVMVAYFDVDNNALKFATNAGGAWATHIVDDGSKVLDEELGYEIAGKWTSITVSRDGRPAIAYYAKINEGGGNVRTEIRYVNARTTTPGSQADWEMFVVEAVPFDPTADAADVFPIPLGTGLFVHSARLSDDSVAVVYYDRVNGNLRLAQFDPVANAFSPAVTVDGGASYDVGWYPSIAVDSGDQLHITYVNASRDDLYYWNSITSTPEIVDDGYRIVGQTEDGLPKPEFHFVGDDSSVVLTTAGPVIAYQDATTHELLLAQKNGAGAWEHHTVAGAEEPFAGGYGFYASTDYDGTQVIMSTYVIDQPGNDNWVEVFRETVVVD